ncbi:MAG: Lrp/AsnC family transcriptional regulator, partial [Myxococcaceae bacterium]
MDDVDAGIVDLLQADARLTQAQIARKVGLSQPSVADRIRKL